MIALAVSGSTVYAGGGFSTIGGQPRPFVGAVDATSGVATSWNPDPGGPVWALVLSGSTLYVGGSFNSIGGQSRNRIAALDTSSGLATSWDPNASGTVNALAVSDSTVYAGGQFATIGGQTRGYLALAALDATTGLASAWNPNPNPGGTCYTGLDLRGQPVVGPCAVSALSIGSDTIYAGGSFSSVPGGNFNLSPSLAAWALNTPATATVTATEVPTTPATATPTGVQPTPGAATATAVPSTPGAPTPTGIPLTPGATNVVVTTVPGIGITLPAVPTAAGGGEVRFAVSTPAAGAVPTQLTGGSRPIKAVFVELSVNAVPNHARLPQPAVVTVDFAAADLPAGSDPLKLLLYLSSDGVTWDALADTRVTDLGGGRYRATASAPHFSFVALGDSHVRVLIPAASRNYGGW